MRVENGYAIPFLFNVLLELTIFLQTSELRYGRHCFPSMFLHTIKNSELRFGPDQAVPHG